MGKTVLIKQLLSEITEPYLLLNGEDVTTRELFERKSVANFMKLLDTKKLLVIDEAQKIPDIGQALKLMIDEIQGLRILVTGSSAFDVENYTGEPLTGRKSTLKLYTLAEQEYEPVETILQRKDNLRERLVFGNYPELLQLSTKEAKTEYLNDLVNSYLLKDILTFDTIRNPDKILSLLRLIAFRIGSLVSIPELAGQLQMSRNTVDRYLDLLSKVFIIHRVGGFSRNLRKRMKYQRYHRILVNNYFWRTYDQQEIDWVEDRGGTLHGYEFKWSPKKNPKVPGAWAKQYPSATYEIINPDNYSDWITDR